MFILVLFAGATGMSHAQVPSGGGLIVNEINQGSTGIKEFMEFLVLGDPVNPCNNVDLTGWIFDDNNGSFENCGSGVGIATGHYRFSSCYNSVPPGALLVVYNAGDVYAGMPADDPLDANGDLVYIIPSNSTCLEANYTQPVSTPANCNYGGSYASPTLVWAAGMANSGDVSQVRKPDHTFFHGFSFGDVTTLFPSWPAGAGAGTSFNLSTGNSALDCGSCWENTSYISTSAGAGTPGAANTVNNSFFIDNLRSCLLNYTDLNDPDNCALILSLQPILLSAGVEENSIRLYAQHTIANAATLSVEMLDAVWQWQPVCAFADVADTQQVYTCTFVPSTWNRYYFRVKMVRTDGSHIFSNTLPVDYSAGIGQVYPNPATNTISIPATDPAEIKLVKVYASDGQEFFVQTEVRDHAVQLNIQHLPAGMYILHIAGTRQVFTQTFIKR